jgi:Xaa-Pro aminopeptidase
MIVVDDVLVTKEGFEDLTSTPKTIDEIEALLA